VKALNTFHGTYAMWPILSLAPRLYIQVVSEKYLHFLPYTII
jgi:hypothetical protein